jgi:hypothetical protein
MNRAYCMRGLAAPVLLEVLMERSVPNNSSSIHLNEGQNSDTLGVLVAMRLSLRVAISIQQRRVEPHLQDVDRGIDVI